MSDKKLNESVRTQNKKKEIFDYHSIVNPMWVDALYEAQDFQNISFDIENNDTLNQKKIIYYKTKYSKRKIRCELWRAGGDWEFPVLYFKVQFEDLYKIKNDKYSENPEFIWDIKPKRRKTSSDCFVMIPPDGEGNYLKDNGKKGFSAYDDNEAPEGAKLDKKLKSEAWKWIVGILEKVVKDRHKEDVNETNHIKGGLSDGMSVKDVATKTKSNLTLILKQLDKGIKVEREHTDNEEMAREIAMDHLVEDPHYYDKLQKMEADEQTMSDASGSFESGLNTPMVKRKINTIHNEKQQEVDEVTDSSSSGSYDVAAFAGPGRKDPLKIDGVKSISNSRAVKDKNFPKWGGPDSVFVKIKDKCKKFPYCNQGDINAIEPLRESIEEFSKEYNIPKEIVENVVIKEINKLFI